MATITYVEHDGVAHEIHVENGYTIMQGAIDNMLDGIVAECGGCCSCATCHVIVDEAWAKKTGEASDIEKDMLECVPDPQPTSRLSCQIVVSEELDGLIVRMPITQY